jgi:membrane fusion protein (multidrug efflux system)
MDDTVKTSSLKRARHVRESGRLWLGFLSLASVIVAAGLAYLWRQAQLFPSTDDAYLGAHVIDVGALVAGRVSEVAIVENQVVNAGTVLFRLDARPFDTALATVQANLDQVVQSVGAAGAAIDGAAASVREREATLTKARAEAARARDLHKSGDASQARLDTAEASLASAQAGLATARAELARAETELGTRNVNNPLVRAALANLEAARFDKEQSIITAPATGYVTGLALRPGALVRANETLFHLVDNTSWWVDANFKETQLARIRACKSAAIRLDMYPGVKLTGKVAGVSAGSGAVFSLFPPENATGNWVKVTQRFPVRIALDPKSTGSHVLRVGASAWARIDTTSCP